MHEKLAALVLILFIVFSMGYLSFGGERYYSYLDVIKYLDEKSIKTPPNKLINTLSKKLDVSQECSTLILHSYITKDVENFKKYCNNSKRIIARHLVVKF